MPSITDYYAIIRVPVVELSGNGQDGDPSILFMGTFPWEPGKTDEIMEARVKESPPHGRTHICQQGAFERTIVFRFPEFSDPAALPSACSTSVVPGCIGMHLPMDSWNALKMFR